MKKLQEVIKPFLSIIFGALLLLCYLNYLSSNGGVLAIGIIALVLAAWYLTAGILKVVLANKLAQPLAKAFDVTNAVFFPAFMFIQFLLLLINGYSGLGPNGWVIILICLVASIGIVILFPVAYFIKNKELNRVTQLFGMVFALALLLNILFDLTGNPVTLGAISVAVTVLYLVFVSMLLYSLGALENKDTPVEEVAETPEE